MYSEPGFLSSQELSFQQAAVNVGISDSGYSITRAIFFLIFHSRINKKWVFSFTGHFLEWSDFVRLTLSDVILYKIS